ncbi:RagB/SusD family nutrient uptake outer membrane protein [Riemerella anatipestifer]|uniref:RagB/SusD family nutrient uptake outer membrane protein n=1 Tax=Riemerella anatipestifer TaxID=34085 RepID=UPI0030BB2373
MKKIILLSLGLSLAGLSTSCGDRDLEPTLAQDKELDQLSTEADLKVFMNGVYSIMRDVNYLGRDYQIYGEVRSDNTFANGNSNRFVIESEFRYTPDQGYMPATWYRIYQVIGRANAVINKGPEAFSGDQDAIRHMIAQAYIIRAMAHFDLTRIFGQYYVSGEGGMNALAVPYVKVFKGDPANLYPVRNTVQEVYDFAKGDIDKAISLINPAKDDYVTKNYISTGSAYALLSRMALYFKDYSVAETASKKVIDLGKYSIATSSNFASTWGSKGANNWIFALYSNTSNEAVGINSLAYIYRTPPAGGGYGDIVGLGNLYDIYESTDVRIASNMVSEKTGDGAGEFRNLGKFPDTVNGGDDIPIFRYEEVVLNYAEALLKNGNATLALEWLNKVPAQRNATLYTVANMENILKERRKEFAFEGMRLHDLLRTDQGVKLIDPVRQRFSADLPAGSSQFAFPIPRTEMNVNANMKQNKGY